MPSREPDNQQEIDHVTHGDGSIDNEAEGLEDTISTNLPETGDLQHFRTPRRQRQRGASAAARIEEQSEVSNVSISSNRGDLPHVRTPQRRKTVSVAPRVHGASEVRNGSEGTSTISKEGGEPQQSDVVEGLVKAVKSLQSQMKNMQESLDKTNERNEYLQRQVTQLRESSGSMRECVGQKFYRFPELGEKLQNRIWRAALDIPRILAVKRRTFFDEHPGPEFTTSWYGSDGVPNSFANVQLYPFNPPKHGTLLPPLAKGHSPLRRMCKAARQQALFDQLGIYDLVKYQLSHPQSHIETGPDTIRNPNIFVRPQIDTLWFFRPQRNGNIPNSSNHDIYLRPILESLVPGRIIKLAISFDQWVAELNYDIWGFMFGLQHLGVRELDLVFEANDAAYPNDPIFVVPRFPFSGPLPPQYPDLITQATTGTCLGTIFRP